MKKKRVLLLFPTLWDARQLASCEPSWRDRFEIVFGEPSLEDCPEDLDVLGYIDAMAARYEGRIDGVLSSSDYPGATVASAIGAALNLPSPAPDRVLMTAHKYYSRVIQRKVVPAATPDFWLIDTRQLDDLPDLPYPVFVKPVKGSFSVHSRKVHSAADLRALLDRPAIRHYTHEYLAIFNDMVTKRLGLDIDGHFFVAESFMHGVQATIEGFVVDGEVSVYGIVDSVFHKDTGSFARFDYPSGLRDEIQSGMVRLAEELIPATGLDRSLFNIEVIYDAATDDVRVVEINPRLCGQFADLYAKVDGQNSYVYALELVTGGRPTTMHGRGSCSAASSFPRRVYRPVRVAAAPSAERVRELELHHQGALIWLECEQGTRLEDFSTWEDGQSVRYAVINLGAASRRELKKALAGLEAELAIDLVPV